MITWKAPIRLSRALCAVECVTDDMRRVWVYVPFRESMEPNLTAAVTAALGRLPARPTYKAG